MLLLLLLFVAEKSRRTKAPVLVLDCLTMEWSRPIISGRYLADRTRHTAVAVFSEDMPDHGKATPVFSKGFIDWKVECLSRVAWFLLSGWWVSPPEGMVLFTVVPILAESNFDFKCYSFWC